MDEFMQMRLSLAFLFLISCFQLAEAQDTPFSYRNIPLGITPIEFKAITFVDQKKWPNIKAICTGDPAATALKYEKLEPGGILKLAGVTACGYLKPDAAGGPMLWAPDFASIGNYRANFYFTPSMLPESSRARLYLISIKFPEQKFDVVFAALNAKYGPASLRTEKFQTKGGGTYDNSVASWSNNVSRIDLSRFGESIDTSRLQYSHTQLSSSVEAAIAAGAKKAAGQL